MGCNLNRADLARYEKGVQPLSRSDIFPTVIDQQVWLPALGATSRALTLLRSPLPASDCLAVMYYSHI